MQNNILHGGLSTLAIKSFIWPHVKQSLSLSLSLSTPKSKLKIRLQIYLSMHCFIQDKLNIILLDNKFSFFLAKFYTGILWFSIKNIYICLNQIQIFHMNLTLVWSVLINQVMSLIHHIYHAFVNIK